MAEVAVDVPIEFHNIPENLEISSENIPRAQIRVRGPQRMVRRLQASGCFRRHRTQRDEAGRTHVRPDGDQIHHPKELEVVQIIPSQFHLTFDARLSRQIPVHPRVVGTFAPGYTIGQIVADPSTVTDQRTPKAGTRR